MTKDCWGQTLEGFQPFSTTIFLPWRDSWAKPVHHLYTTNRCQLSEWDITPVHSNAHPTAHYEAATGPPLLITCFREPLDSPGLVWSGSRSLPLCPALQCIQSLPVLAPMTQCIGMLASGARQLTASTSVNKLIAGDWRTTQWIQGRCSLQLQQYWSCGGKPVPCFPVRTGSHKAAT